MAKLASSWKDDVPLHLVGAVEKLRQLYFRAIIRFGGVSSLLCFESLHGTLDGATTDTYRSELQALKAAAGFGATKDFEKLIREGTGRAIFSAFFLLYRLALLSRGNEIFQHLLKLGRRSESQLATGYITWSVGQISNLINNHRGNIEGWIREACDGATGLSNFNQEGSSPPAILWSAPRFLILVTESKDHLGSPDDWYREDELTSRQILRDLSSQMFIRPLQGFIEDQAKLAELDHPESGRRPRSAPRSTTRPQTKNEEKKQRTIFRAIEARLKAMDYCTELDRGNLRPPKKWTDNGCPATYREAYGKWSEGWRQKIWDEKYRYSQKLKKLTPRERSGITNSRSRTRQ